MRSLKAFAILSIALLATLYTVSTARAQAKQPEQDPTIMIVQKGAEHMKAQLTTHAQAMPEKQKDRLMALIKKQQEQLAALRAKYRAAPIKSANAGQMSIDLGPFFQTTASIRKALQSGQSSVRTVEYSADPSYCSNHCERTCGYGSLGEKVCWLECYRCCGKGGC